MAECAVIGPIHAIYHRRLHAIRNLFAYDVQYNKCSCKGTALCNNIGIPKEILYGIILFFSSRFIKSLTLPINIFKLIYSSYNRYKTKRQINLIEMGTICKL